MTGADPLLKVDAIDVSYGRRQVLYGLSAHVDRGEFVALLGLNGAGKSTLLKAIQGLLRPTSGTIAFDGTDITAVPPHALASMGLGHVPGGRGLLPGLTVMENLRAASYPFRRTMGRGWKQKADEVLEMFPSLEERRDTPTGNLSGGEQQMVAIARALMTSPKLLMVDEMSLGLAPLIVQRILETVREINRQGVATMIVEQNATLALSVADRAYFLEKGEARFEGPAAELAGRQDLLRSVFLAGAAAGFGKT